MFRHWLNQNSDGSFSGGAEAVCVDVPATGLLFYEWDAPTNGSFTETMFQNDGTWACGLTGLFGVFMDSWSQPGASVFLDANNNWDVTVANQRQVRVGCVQ